MKCVWRPVLDPREARRLARLLRTVVAAIAERAEQHFGSALGRYFSGHAGICNRALEDTAAQRHAVDDGSSRFVEIGIGRYGLRIKEIKVGVLQGMGRIVKTGGKRVVGRNNRVDLGKGVDRFEPCFICWKRKGPNRLLMKQVLGSL